VIKILNAFFGAIFLILFCFEFSLSQKVSFSNTLNYGTGKENTGDSEIDKRKEYLDNLADLRIFYDNITIGARYDLDKPAEYGLPYNGIRKKFIQYTKDGFDIRAGDIYTLFSRGLALNLFENKTLAFDNGLTGIKIQYQNKLFKAIVLGGDIEYTDPLTVLSSAPYKENYKLRAGNFEITPLKGITSGMSFVWTEMNPSNSNSLDQEPSVIQMPELYLNYRSTYLDIYAGYTIKYTKISGLDSSTGTGFYGALTHNGENYGITLEYKNYRYDVIDPFNRLNTHRLTRFLPIQNPPIVFKENSFTLLSRYEHTPDFNDETGIQLDINYSLTPECIFNLNYSASSRNFSYNITDKDLLLFKKKEIGSFLPSGSDEFSPFWELYADAEYYFDPPSSFLKAGFDIRNEITYNELWELSASKAAHPLKSVTIPLLVQYAFDEKFSVKFSSEEQWVKKSQYPKDNDFYNQLVSMQISHSPDYIFGLLFEYTSNEYEINKETTWLSGNFSYRYNSRHTITLSYGSERGGQICSNGICRLVYPFKGLRFSVVSNL
jgi:hypothetical protein